MIVVIDTNILISAALRGGFPARAVLYCAANQPFSWYISTEILGEYHEVLHRPKFSFPAPKLEYWVNLIARSTILIDHIPAARLPPRPQRRKIPRAGTRHFCRLPHYGRWRLYRCPSRPSAAHSHCKRVPALC